MENKPADLTAAPEKSPEHIEREMQSTRNALTQKVAALEQTVTGNIQSVTQSVSDVKDAVKETVDTVKDTLSGAASSVTDSLKASVHTVADTVKQTLDVTGHVRSHPLLSVGVSAAAGFLTGLLLPGGRRSYGAPPPPAYAPPGVSPAYAAAPAAPREPGLFDQLFGMIGGEVRQMARMALESASEAVKRNINTGVPKLIDDAAANVIPTGTDPGPSRPGYAARG